MTVYESTYNTTTYEIVDTPFSHGEYEEEQYDPFLEVPYQWQNQRFTAPRSPLEQRMIVVPALAGLMVILFGIFALSNIVFSGSGGAAAAGEFHHGDVKPNQSLRQSKEIVEKRPFLPHTQVASHLSSPKK